MDENPLRSSKPEQMVPRWKVYVAVVEPTPDPRTVLRQRRLSVLRRRVSFNQGAYN